MILNGTEQSSVLIVLNKGEKLIETLTQFIRGNGIKGGAIGGLGALTDVVLGYYDLPNQVYLRKTFSDDDYELLSLQGNISLKDDAPFVHAHVVLGARDFSTFGGHLFEAVVAVTAEISIVPLGRMPKRHLNDSVGIATICGF